jgi:hypothetical protein
MVVALQGSHLDRLAYLEILEIHQGLEGSHLVGRSAAPGTAGHMVVGSREGIDLVVENSAAVVAVVVEVAVDFAEGPEVDLVVVAVELPIFDNSISRVRQMRNVK